MTRVNSLLWVLALIASTWGAAADAAAQARRSTVTKVEDADADYPRQGEYSGMVIGLGPAGLQVIALGQGNFEAYLLTGGLPGAGWDKKGREKFVGGTSGDRVLLVSDTKQITLAGTEARVSQTSGQPLGTLAKVARLSPTMNLSPAPGATVLFADGKASELIDARVSPEGYLEIGATTKSPVRDFRLHLEFKTPYQPTARGQGRGNSGVYIQRRYEVQILDSFGLEGLFNECGALYRQTPPDVNMALPPLVWQTYDIWFTAAKFDAEGKKTAPARITVWHNGIPVHDNRAIPGKTGAGQAESDKPLPIHLQNHGNPVQFRNIWIVQGEPTHPAEAAAQAAAAAQNACPPAVSCGECCCRRVVLRCGRVRAWRCR